MPQPLIEVDASAVHELIRGNGSENILVNVWATWCRPCVEEMPDLLRIRDEFKDQGFDLILVSADFTTQTQAVSDFLSENGIGFQTYIKNQIDNDFIPGLHPDWSGVLPVSILFNRDGEALQIWQGKVSYEELKEAIAG